MRQLQQRNSRLFRQKTHWKATAVSYRVSNSVVIPTAQEDKYFVGIIFCDWTNFNARGIGKKFLRITITVHMYLR